MMKLEIYNNIGSLKDSSNNYEFPFENGYIETNIFLKMKIFIIDNQI